MWTRLVPNLKTLQHISQNYRFKDYSSFWKKLLHRHKNYNIYSRAFKILFPTYLYFPYADLFWHNQKTLLLKGNVQWGWLRKLLKNNNKESSVENIHKETCIHIKTNKPWLWHCSESSGRMGRAQELWSRFRRQSPGGADVQDIRGDRPQGSWVSAHAWCLLPKLQDAEVHLELGKV